MTNRDRKGEGNTIWWGFLW